MKAVSFHSQLQQAKYERKYEPKISKNRDDIAAADRR
jgi:hypothetical protein